ncbi:hypothetical protein LTR86_006570 [Recurvomyces mirabilis]|nr:hypothetical protein LTR86_006570 [Recurvomyces mirabilis]
MVDKNELATLLPGVDVKIPSEGDDVTKHISRWSNTRLSLPAAIITPVTETDVINTIRFASSRKEGKQKVIPTGGGHGTFVPIDSRTLYLNLSHFKSIHLDEEVETVTFGGGLVLKYLGERGWYTSVPNSNAVGMVGYVLGGGSSPFNAVKGLAIDNVVMMRVVTAGGVVVEVGPESVGEEADLFRVLCGAGFGFGVVVQVTLSAWRIRDLRMNEGKIWTRKLIFPPTAIRIAAETFVKMQKPNDRMVVVLLLMRAPPSAPRPGASMIMLNASFFGPAVDAVEAAAPLFDENITSQVIVADTGAVSLSSMNDFSAPLDRHGDFKEFYSAWSPGLSAATIVTAFDRWLAFGEATAEAKAATFMVFAAKGTKGMLEHDPQGQKFFPRPLRSRYVFVQAVPWWTAEKAEEASRTWGAETMSLVNAPQHERLVEGSGLADGDWLTAHAANLSKGIDLSTTWAASQLEESRRIKSVWDAGNLFWNPVVDGV